MFKEQVNKIQQKASRTKDIVLRSLGDNLGEEEESDALVIEPMSHAKEDFDSNYERKRLGLMVEKMARIASVGIL